MSPPTVNFPPLKERILILLDELKGEINNRRGLGTSDPEFADKLREINKKIDELSVKILRGGAILSRPAESRHPGFRIVFDSPGNSAKILPGAVDFHPELPPWAEGFFVEWIQGQRLREKGRETLRKTKIPGLETGMHPPRDMTLMLRVLELRGAVQEDDTLIEVTAIEPPLDTMAEMMEKSRKLVTEEMIKNGAPGGNPEKKRARVRKERRSWKFVIRNLVKDGLLPKEITPQALKRMLKVHYPEWPWDEV
uniref:Uncharacterized protein n=1 Tax=Desulfobacca acetoxidans TaxID=60893 RepID=A0A7C3WIZ3_9BACT